MKHQTEFEFWDSVRDKISGLEGTVVSVAYYVSGCTHIGIAASSLDSNGAVKNVEFLDDARIELIGREEPAPEKEKPIQKRGGPSPSPVCK